MFALLSAHVSTFKNFYTWVSVVASMLIRVAISMLIMAQ